MWKVTEILMEELKRLDKVEEERDLSVVENVQKTQVIADVESFFLKEKYLKDKNREHYSWRKEIDAQRSFIEWLIHIGEIML